MDDGNFTANAQVVAELPYKYSTRPQNSRSRITCSIRRPITLRSSIDFSSLRLRLLLPLLLSATIAALLVAGLSFAAGRSWALREIQARRDAIEKTLEQASFPITESVARPLALLLGAEIVVLDESRRVSASSLRLDTDTGQRLAALLQISDAANSIVVSETEAKINIGDRQYIASFFQRQRKDSAATVDRFVIALFDRKGIEAASRRAAMLPLLTGLSTIGLLSTVTLLLSARIANRISSLQQSVQLVALGNFDVSVDDQSLDELGRLGRAVDRMSDQLKRLWKEVNRRQSDKLLHQLSAGMAHQLRNTLTGARLAIELHQQSHALQSQELAVAIRELTIAEDYVQRILMVGTGEHRQSEQPATVADCLETVRASQDLVARHLGVELTWTVDPALARYTVADGATLNAALSNLVTNAIQAGKCVEVRAAIAESSQCKIVVQDNGPGVEKQLADDLFEPFVTSKPEGMGLGLPVVRRAAQKLAGTIVWERAGGFTCFHLTVPVDNASNSNQ